MQQYSKYVKIRTNFEQVLSIFYNYILIFFLPYFTFTFDLKIIKKHHQKVLPYSQGVSRLRGLILDAPQMLVLI